MRTAASADNASRQRPAAHTRLTTRALAVHAPPHISPWSRVGRLGLPGVGVGARPRRPQEVRAQVVHGGRRHGCNHGLLQALPVGPAQGATAVIARAARACAATLTRRRPAPLADAQDLVHGLRYPPRTHLSIAFISSHAASRGGKRSEQLMPRAARAILLRAQGRREA
jgi:hypothetical protein